MHKEKLGSKDDEPEIIQQTMSRMGGRRMSMVQKEEAMLECVAALALEEKAKLQAVFELFDKDGSGEVCRVCPLENGYVGYVGYVIF
jgi:hypothetical protein